MIKKVFLLVFSIILALIFSEFCLRTAGRIYYKTWKWAAAKKINQIEDEFQLLDKKNNSESGLISVLCLGDSWTFGVGASPGYSYPAQLQQIFNKEEPGKYKVYNGGSPGITSTRLLKNLPGLLKEYNPNIVVILIGQNDFGYLTASEIILFSKFPKKFYAAVKNITLDSRLYKIVRLGFDGAKESFFPLKKQRYSPIQKINPESAEYNKISKDFLMAGETDTAERYLENAIAIDSNNESAYMHLAQIYWGKKEYAKVLDISEKLIQINPYTLFRKDLYRLLFCLYQKKIKELQKRLLGLIRSIPSDGVFRNPGTPFILNEKIITINLENNLYKMVNLLKANKAIPIFQTYFKGKNYQCDSVERDFFKKQNIAFVDNYDCLEEISDIEIYFSKDGHPNVKGYHLIAANVYKTIKNFTQGDLIRKPD